MTAVHKEVSTQLWSTLWKSSFSSDHHPSHYLPCSRQFPLLSSPNKGRTCSGTGVWPTGMLPASLFPSPHLPWVSEFPIRHLPESSQVLCPRCIPEPELGEHSRISLEHPDPGLCPQTLVSELGPTPARSAVWLLYSSGSAHSRPGQGLFPRQSCLAAADVSDSSESASQPKSEALGEPSRGLRSVCVGCPGARKEAQGCS